MFGPDLLAAPVVTPGARRAAAVRARRALDRLLARGGYRRARRGLPALRRGAGAARAGAGTRCPAPLDELPLLVRAGAVLPLLPADVDTLAPYGRGAWSAWPSAGRS